MLELALELLEWPAPRGRAGTVSEGGEGSEGDAAVAVVHGCGKIGGGAGSMAGLEYSVVHMACTVMVLRHGLSLDEGRH